MHFYIVRNIGSFELDTLEAPSLDDAIVIAVEHFGFGTLEPEQWRAVQLTDEQVEALGLLTHNS